MQSSRASPLGSVLMKHELTSDQHRELQEACASVVQRWIDKGLFVPPELMDTYRNTKCGLFLVTDECREKMRRVGWDD